MKAVSYMVISELVFLCFFVLVCFFQFQFQLFCFQVYEYTSSTVLALPGLHAVMEKVKSLSTPCSHTREQV
jgi:hypothetical protein